MKKNQLNPVFEFPPPPTTYQVVATKSKGNGHKFKIVGLQRINYFDRLKPDSRIFPGMHQACDSPESIVLGIYAALYDEFQMNDNLKDGDRFRIPARTVYKFLSFDKAAGRVRIPELTFVCAGVHVEPADLETTVILQEASKIQKEKTEGDK